MGSGGDEERGWILEEGNVGCNVFFFNEDLGKDSKIQTSQITSFTRNHLEIKEREGAIFKKLVLSTYPCSIIN